MARIRGRGRGPCVEWLEGRALHERTRDTALSKLKFRSSFVCTEIFSGGYIGGVTPVPISNTEVKPSRADGTPR